MGLRDRMQERRGGGATTRHYKMRQKLVSFGDDFWIEDDQGNRAYKVDGKMLRVRDTLIFEDAQGNQLAQIQQKMLRVRDTMNIEAPDGSSMASVRKAMIAPLRERWVVKIGDGPDLKVQGNILDHEYTIEGDNGKVAEVSKKWFRVADSYGVEVADGQNPVVLLAVATVIDAMAHEEK